MLSSTPDGTWYVDSKESTEQIANIIENFTGSAMRLPFTVNHINKIGSD